MKNLKNATTEAAIRSSHDLKGVRQVNLKFLANCFHCQILF